MNPYEITVDGFPSATCSIEADTAKQARWFVIRDMREYGMIGRKQWPNVKAVLRKPQKEPTGNVIIIK